MNWKIKRSGPLTQSPINGGKWWHFKWALGMFCRYRVNTPSLNRTADIIAEAASACRVQACIEAKKLELTN
jgi:hypothetical protein